ncbi:hypothetical protein HN604_01165 [archaeon]|nr:hypothetical protein [archaeon]MBT6606773.1 hypothetical protein [archaeon]MBT7660673.1 hypothetical protein [archaeon]
MNNDYGEFTTGLAKIILDAIMSAPDSQIHAPIKESTKNYFSTKRTLPEQYDYFTTLSKKPLTQISPFVRNLCEVHSYYPRPVED